MPNSYQRQLFVTFVLTALTLAGLWVYAQPPGDPLAEAPSATDTTIGADNATDAPDEATVENESGESIWKVVRSAGIVGLLIVVLSIGAVALIIEHILTIRASNLLPSELAESLVETLSSGRYNEAVELCRDDPSMLSHVIEAGVVEIESGWAAVEKAVEDALAEQVARLYRKIEYLSVIGNIAPMMGLLGTVVGMVFAFRELSISQGAPQAADLADGIYQALVTTVLGLVVAIPSLAAFAVFRNRVDYFAAETAYVAQHVLGPVKRAFLRQASGASKPKPRSAEGRTPQQPAPPRTPPQAPPESPPKGGQG